MSGEALAHGTEVDAGFQDVYTDLLVGEQGSGVTGEECPGLIHHPRHPPFFTLIMLTIFVHRMMDVCLHQMMLTWMMPAWMKPPKWMIPTSG